MRTGLSKPMFDKTCTAEPFSPAKRTMVTKNNSVGVRNPIQVRHALPQETKTGAVGNLSTAAMHVFHAGSCVYLRRSFGVTEDCGAITRYRCLALFTECIFP